MKVLQTQHLSSGAIGFSASRAEAEKLGHHGKLGLPHQLAGAEGLELTVELLDSGQERFGLGAVVLVGLDDLSILVDLGQLDPRRLRLDRFRDLGDAEREPNVDSEVVLEGGGVGPVDVGQLTRVLLGEALGVTEVAAGRTFLLGVVAEPLGDVHPHSLVVGGEAHPIAGVGGIGASRDALDGLADAARTGVVEEGDEESGNDGETVHDVLSFVSEIERLVNESGRLSVQFRRSAGPTEPKPAMKYPVPWSIPPP